MYLFAFAVVIAGCKKDDKGEAGETLTVATYNVGLADGFVAATPDRAPKVAEAAATIDADVVCLQEVWDPDHVEMFATAAQDAYPNQYFPEAQQVTEDEPACEDPDMLAVFTDCLETSCPSDCADELVDCAFSACAVQFLSLLNDKDCLGCVMANVGGTVADVQDACLNGDTWYAYGGSFGTGILSAHPIQSTEEHVFESTSNRRSVLHAVIDAPVGEVDLYCTHLTAVFTSIPYPRDEGSWAEEQGVQMEEMVSFIDESASAGLTVLLGDMNSGPAVGESKAVEEENWQILAGTGMGVPYVEAKGECTFCPDNPLIGSGNPEIIDHVLQSGFADGTPVERLFTDTISAEACGTEIEAAYSDHYGVKATLSPK